MLINIVILLIYLLYEINNPGDILRHHFRTAYGKMVNTSAAFVKRKNI